MKSSISNPVESRMRERLVHLGLARQPLVVGFSGGRDSLALAAALSRVAPDAADLVTLVHVDHRLRPASATEASAARDLAVQVGLPFRLVALPAGVQARHPGVGREEAARRERHVALASIASVTGSAAVVLGHQLEDQVETVLLHLLRGTGPAGIAAMTDDARLPVRWWTDDKAGTVRVVRPFLSLRRDDLSAYLRQLRLEPLQDESNSDLSFTRNHVRSTLLPALEAISPGALGAIARYADVAGAEDAHLAELAVEWTRRAVCSTSSGAVTVDLGALEAAPEVLFRRVLRAAAPVDLTADRVAALAELARERTAGKVLELGSGFAGTVDDATLVVAPAADLAGILAGRHGLLLIAEDRVASISGAAAGIAVEPGSATLVVRSGQQDGDLVVRPVRAGDRWAITGSEVRETLRVAGVPALIRHRLPCVASGAGVMAVVGVSSPAGQPPVALERDGDRWIATIGDREAGT